MYQGSVKGSIRNIDLCDCLDRLQYELLQNCRPQSCNVQQLLHYAVYDSRMYVLLRTNVHLKKGINQQRIPFEIASSLYESAQMEQQSLKQAVGQTSRSRYIESNIIMVPNEESGCLLSQTRIQEFENQPTMNMVHSRILIKHYVCQDQIQSNQISEPTAVESGTPENSSIHKEFKTLASQLQSINCLLENFKTRLNSTEQEMIAGVMTQWQFEVTKLLENENALWKQITSFLDDDKQQSRFASQYNQLFDKNTTLQTTQSDVFIMKQLQNIRYNPQAVDNMLKKMRFGALVQNHDVNKDALQVSPTLEDYREYHAQKESKSPNHSQSLDANQRTKLVERKHLTRRTQIINKAEQRINLQLPLADQVFYKVDPYYLVDQSELRKTQQGAKLFQVDVQQQFRYGMPGVVRTQDLESATKSLLSAFYLTSQHAQSLKEMSPQQSIMNKVKDIPLLLKQTKPKKEITHKVSPVTNVSQQRHSSIRTGKNNLPDHLGQSLSREKTNQKSRVDSTKNPDIKRENTKQIRHQSKPSKDLVKRNVLKH